MRGDAETLQGSFPSLCYPHPSSYKPIPLPQIHVHLLILRYARVRSVSLGSLSNFHIFPSMRYAGVLSGTQSSFRTLTSVSHRPLRSPFETDAPFMTPGTHTTPSSFFEEEEAANMPFSADTTDGAVSGYACVHGGRYCVESGGRGVERYQGPFCSLFYCYHLMAVIHRCKMHCFFNIPNLAAHLVALFPNFTWDRMYGTHSFLPFPSHPVSQQHTAQGIFRRQMLSTCPSSCLMLPASLKGTKLLRCHDTPDSRVRDECGGEGWNTEGHDTGRRARMV